MKGSTLYVSPWWQAALLPDTIDVCGVVVPPLSVWHVFALEQIGNPYLVGGRVSRDDVACMLLLAGRDRAGGRAVMLGAWARDRAVRRIFRRLRRVSDIDLFSAAKDYASVSLRAPDHMRKENADGKPLAAPLAYHLVACLCGAYRVPLAEAWDMPYAQARCYFDAWYESEGDRSLADARLQQSIDDWVEREAKEKAS